MKKRKVKSELNMSDAEMLNLPENKRFENVSEKAQRLSNKEDRRMKGRKCTYCLCTKNDSYAAECECSHHDKTQHTPTPDECIGLLNLMGGNANHKEAYDFIVRAVNSHKDLLEALKIAEAFMGGFEDDETQVGIGKRLKWIRDAIAKAEEGLL